MIGMDALSAAALLVLAASPVQCPDVPPAKINVVPKTKEIAYDYTRSMTQLQGTQTDTIDPYGFHGITMTQGFMQGQIRMQPRVELDYKHIPERRAVCLWYKSIDIEIEIDPSITIAKEVAADKCMGRAVLEHEMKHVKADRQIVNKYAKIMGRKVYDALSERGFRVGPIADIHGQETANRMQKVVQQVLEHEYQKMALERTEAQQSIDNLQEYERVNALCPEFDMRRAAAQGTKKKRGR